MTVVGKRIGRTRPPRYVRRDGHPRPHLCRPHVCAPDGALYSGSDTGAPRKRSATARHRRELVRGVRPARRRAVVRFRRVTERLSTPRTDTPSWGKIRPEPNFGVGCSMSILEPAFRGLGAVAQATGAPLSGATGRAPLRKPARAPPQEVGDIGSFAVDTTLGGVGRRSPVSIATKATSWQ